MKLYVWEDVFCDYTCGIAFALAENLKEARQLITGLEKKPTYFSEIWDLRPTTIVPVTKKYSNKVNGGA